MSFKSHGLVVHCALVLYISARFSGFRETLQLGLKTVPETNSGTKMNATPGFETLHLAMRIWFLKGLPTCGNVAVCYVLLCTLSDLGDDDGGGGHGRDAAVTLCLLVVGEGL